MGSEIGCGGGSLLRGHDRFRRMLAIAAGCVLIGVLWAAGPANAASHRWVIANASNVKLTLVSVTPYEHHHMGFEGRPANGSVLHPGTRRDPKEQHFELEFGANVQAVLKYRIFDSDNYVEMWIKNALHFGDARCRFIKGTHVGDWELEPWTWGADPFGTGLTCYAFQALSLGTHYVTLVTGAPGRNPPS
jgi:hypothetical protein